MADPGVMIVNNASNQQATYRITPKGFEPIEGDLPPLSYSNLNVPISTLYQIAWNRTVEGETRSPLALVTFDGHKIVSTAPF
ncbi:MAG: hypothetical protein K0U98_26250 [Deltaproteobacteria bacterium]|nr:hypothetical protein [Deltaproteobacteria bacterium]